jgi:hypothetical protein
MEQVALNIFMVASTPVPECIANISEHNIMDHATLIGTLRAWEDKLEDYQEEESATKQAIQGLSWPEEGPQYLGRLMEEQAVPGLTHRGQTSATTLDSMQIEDMPIAQGQDNDQIMDNLG